MFTWWSMFQVACTVHHPPLASFAFIPFQLSDPPQKDTGSPHTLLLVHHRNRVRCYVTPLHSNTSNEYRVANGNAVTIIKHKPGKSIAWCIYNWSFISALCLLIENDDGFEADVATAIGLFFFFPRNTYPTLFSIDDLIPFIYIYAILVGLYFTMPL